MCQFAFIKTEMSLNHCTGFDWQHKQPLSQILGPLLFIALFYILNSHFYMQWHVFYDPLPMANVVTISRLSGERAEWFKWNVVGEREKSRPNRPDIMKWSGFTYIFGLSFWMVSAIHHNRWSLKVTILIHLESFIRSFLHWMSCSPLEHSTMTNYSFPKAHLTKMASLMSLGDKGEFAYDCCYLLHKTGHVKRQTKSVAQACYLSKTAVPKLIKDIITSLD